MLSNSCVIKGLKTATASFLISSIVKELFETASVAASRHLEVNDVFRIASELSTSTMEMVFFRDSIRMSFEILHFSRFTEINWYVSFTCWEMRWTVSMNFCSASLVSSSLEEETLVIMFSSIFVSAVLEVSIVFSDFLNSSC